MGTKKITLIELIYKMGEAQFAIDQDMGYSTTMSWKNGSRIPKPRKAKQMIRDYKGRKEGQLSWESIYDPESFPASLKRANAMKKKPGARKLEAAQ